MRSLITAISGVVRGASSRLGSLGAFPSHGSLGCSVFVEFEEDGGGWYLVGFLSVTLYLVTSAGLS